jgi:hypothetical protein
MDAIDGSVNDGLFRAGVSVYVNACGCQARDKLVAMARFYVRLHDGSCLCCLVSCLSRRKVFRIRMTDWQTIVVVLIILAACFFVARRGWFRLRAMNAEDGSCETGCGKCETSSTATKSNKKSLVQIVRLTVGKKSMN